MNFEKKRGLLTSGIVILFILFCLGIVGVRLLLSIFPVSVSSPRFDTRGSLGEGEAIAFTYMRVDILRPFELYIFDDINGVRSYSQGFMRSDIAPLWSPDGSQIVYKSVSSELNRYYLVEADGSNRRQITSDDRPKELLRWSPDGSHIAYLTYDQNSDGSISNSPYLCITGITTGDTRKAPVGNVQDLVWMPDSQSLLAIEQAEDLVTIELYDANGNHEQSLFEAGYLREAASITISPDATRVAYLRLESAEEIASMTASLNVSTIDGSATKTISTFWTEGSIVWSPDSTRIAFIALTNDFEYALYVANADGTEFQELMLLNTGDESGEILPAAPVWSPDGTRIAIASLYDPEASALFVLNADGTEQRQIITAAGPTGMIYDLAWQPGK
jgi:Tol biopolymer transport system component